MTIDRPLGEGEGSNHLSCLFQHPEVHGVRTVGGSRDTGTPTSLPSEWRQQVLLTAGLWGLRLHLHIAKGGPRQVLPQEHFTN